MTKYSQIRFFFPVTKEDKEKAKKFIESIRIVPEKEEKK